MPLPGIFSWGRVVFGQRLAVVKKAPKKHSKHNTSVRLNLKTAVGDGKFTQSFDAESFKSGGPFTKWEREPPLLNDSASKPWRTLSSRTAVSRLNCMVQIKAMNRKNNNHTDSKAAAVPRSIERPRSSAGFLPQNEEKASFILICGSPDQWGE